MQFKAQGAETPPAFREAALLGQPPAIYTFSERNERGRLKTLCSKAGKY